MVQGESVEEAVAREVSEEAGIPLTSVELLGSQPWPIGMPLRSLCLYTPRRWSSKADSARC